MHIKNMTFSSLIRSRLSSTWSTNVTSRIKTIQVPEKLKGTIVEKWVTYWKQLVIDYKEMVIDTGKWMKDHPAKTTVYGIIGTGIYVMNDRNPTLDDFREQFLKSSNELILVHPSCQNSVAAEHVTQIERWYNNGLIRRLTLGVVSFIWVADFHKDVALYKAKCEYLEPEYATFHTRVIDVGFWNKFWVLEKKMIDYDVNEANV